MFTRIIFLMSVIVMLVACTTTTPDHRTELEKRGNIDTNVNSGLRQLYSEVSGSHEMVAKSAGVLVFPSVLSAALVVGGEYGEGELLVNKQVKGYYKLTTGSVGLQAGAQSKSIILLFMTKEALTKFINSKGWTIGLDADVALFRVSANGQITTQTAQAPITGFVLTNGGIMFDISLQGSKISPLKI